MNLIAALILMLFSAAPVAAESPWMLWKQPTLLKGGDRNWEFSATYRSVNDCTRALDDLEADARKRIPFTDISRPAPTDLFLRFREDKSGAFNSGLTWRCLPDTLDPRGPKGR